jgi:hypothetical protein
MADARAHLTAQSVGSGPLAMASTGAVLTEQLGLPTGEVPAENFGVLGMIFAIDQPSSSALTRERFGWEPTHPSLLDDLQAGHYPG